MLFTITSRVRSLLSHEFLEIQNLLVDVVVTQKTFPHRAATQQVLVTWEKQQKNITWESESILTEKQNTISTKRCVHSECGLYPKRTKSNCLSCPNQNSLNAATTGLLMTLCKISCDISFLPSHSQKTATQTCDSCAGPKIANPSDKRDVKVEQ